MPAWKATLAKQLPFLSKALGIGASAPSRAASEDATDANIKVPVAGGSDEKRKKLIRAVVILGVLYLAYDTLVPTDEPEVVTEVPPPPRKKKNRKKVQPEKAVETAATPTETPGTTEAPTAATDATAPKTDVSTINDTETEASAPVEATAGTTPEPADVEAASDANLNGTDLGLPKEDASTQGEGTGSDQVADEPKVDDASGDMTQQILKDLEKQIDNNQTPSETISKEYVGPPDYENVGRGLVYNCLGKHWACIDGPSFKICQQNQAALKDKGKNAECLPDSVYQSDSACAWVQKQKITGNIKSGCN